MIHIFSIEGNIGSGKSTIVKNLKKRFEKLDNYDIVYFLEPVNVWESIKNENNENIIQCFYKDNKKYAFSFQMLAYISRNNILNDVINNCKKDTIIITERSIFTDKNVFAKMLYKDKSMNEIEYKIYTKWFESYSNIKQDYNYIYINTDVDTCSKRIKKRSRKGESIPKEYLLRCKKFHDEWLDNEQNILKVDGNQDNGESIKYYELLNTIIKYIDLVVKRDKYIQGTNLTLQDIMDHPFF